MSSFYKCECGAEYAITGVDVPELAHPSLVCEHCGRGLPAGEDPTAALQYTLLKRPNTDTLQDL